MQSKVWKDQSHSIVDLCVEYCDSKIVKLVSVLRTLDRTGRELCWLTHSPEIRWSI